jgi:hypothetical protein
MEVYRLLGFQMIGSLYHDTRFEKGLKISM